MDWGLTYFDERLNAYRLRPHVAVEDAKRELALLSPDYIPKSVSRLARFTSQGDADQISDLTAIRRYAQSEISKRSACVNENELSLRDLGAREQAYLPKSFGQYLSRIRRKAGQTQTSVTRLASLPHSSLARYEAGETTPTISAILRLAALVQSAGVPFPDFKREYIVLKLGPEEGTVGDILSRERWFAQMSAKELARKTGFAPSYIRALEKDKVELDWSLHLTLKTLARALTSARLLTLAKELQNEK